MEINQEAIFLLLQKEKRVTEGEVVGWHHQFNGQEHRANAGRW